MRYAFAVCAAAFSIASTAVFAAQPEGLHDLINTFAEDMHFYTTDGYAVQGPDSNMGWQQVAVPFTPDANYVLKDITVAAQHNWFDTTNGLSVSLNEDSNGKPGAEIKKHRYTDLPEFYECCTVTTFKVKDVPVTAGTKYWVVIKTDKATRDAIMVWNRNSVGTQGTFAVNKNNLGWFAYTDALPAIRVRGR